MEIQSYQKFVIVGMARSGTHMIRSALETHPEIKCYGEALHPNWGADFAFEGRTWPLDVGIIDSLHKHVWRQNYSTNVNAVGFSFIFDYENEDYYTKLYETISDFTNVTFIHLHRLNEIERYVSFLEANKTGVWHNKPPNVKVEYRRKAHKECLFRHSERLEFFYRSFRNHRHEHLIYEDLCNGHDWRYVQDILGVERLSIAPTLPKMNNRPMRERVWNFEELIGAKSNNK